LTRELGLTIVDTDFNSPACYSLDGGPVDVTGDDVVLDELRAAISKVDNHNTKMAALLEDMISNSTLAAAAALRRVVDAEVFLDAPWDLSDLSAKFGFEAGVGEGDRWIVGGYKQLLERLADGVQVDLEWPVTSIEGCDASGNTVRGSRGESATAAAVIVTAPVNLLRAGSIAFQPPLPEEHRHALDLLIGGRAEKVALQFETCWWPATPGYIRISGKHVAGIDGCNGGDQSEWLEITDTVGKPVLVGLFVSPWCAEIWDGHTDEEVALLATWVLRSSLAPSIASSKP
jgi:monoamine oxidase